MAMAMARITPPTMGMVWPLPNSWEMPNSDTNANPSAMGSASVDSVLSRINQRFVGYGAAFGDRHDTRRRTAQVEKGEWAPA